MTMSAILSVSYYCAVAVLLLMVAVFSLFTLYIRYVHWKFSHIPSPKRPSFYFGHALEVTAAQRKNGNVGIPFHEHIYKWYLATESEVFVIFFIWKVMVVTLNPDDIKNLFMDSRNGRPDFTMESFRYLYGERFAGNGLFSIADIESWKPRRRQYDPAFNKGYLKSLVPSFNGCADQFLARLRPLADGRTQVSMTQQFYEFTLDVISKWLHTSLALHTSDFVPCCQAFSPQRLSLAVLISYCMQATNAEVGFGSDLNRGWSDHELGLKRVKGTGKLSFLKENTIKGLERVIVFPFPQLLKYLYPFEVAGYRETTRAIRVIGRDCIQRQIRAMEIGESSCNNILAHIIGLIKTGEHIDLEDLVDDFVTFYFAGQQTTANLLSFSLALVLLHPQVLERLLSEIDEVLEDKDIVGVEDLEQLQYTEQVLLETLRLYPPVPVISRGAKKGGMTLSGYRITEGTQISLPTVTVAHMPEHFEDPEVFRPSRFDPDREKPSPFTYFPFGAGQRSCIGKQFALMETKIAFARFLHTFKATLRDDYKLVAGGNFELRPTGTLPCVLEHRK